MLCEDCDQREATVHFAIVSWPSGEVYRHLCESCHLAAQAQSMRTYSAQPTTPLPTDIEHITAEDYLRLSAKATANGSDKPAFKHLSGELERLPTTRARLSLELLRMALDSLEQGNDPYNLIGLGGCFGNSVQTAKCAEYIELLAKVVARTFERLAQLSQPPSAHPFGFGLTLAVIALRRADPDRCAAILTSLKDQNGVEGDHRRRLMDYVEMRVAEANEKRDRRKRGNEE